MINFVKLGEKEYSLELNLKDSNGKVIGTKTVEFRKGAVQEYEMDVATYAKTGEDFEVGYSQYFYATIDRILMTADKDFIPKEWKKKDK